MPVPEINENSFENVPVWSKRAKPLLAQMADAAYRVLSMEFGGVIKGINTANGILIYADAPDEDIGQKLFAVQVAVSSLANIGVPVIGTSPVTCSPALCGPSSVLPKIVCSVPTPVDYVAWQLCDTPGNDNKLNTTTPITRPEPNPYQTAVGQWSDASESIEAWDTKSTSCGTLAVPATFGRGYGYFDCDGAFVLVRVAEEKSLEIVFGFGGFIEYLHHIELCEDPTGTFQVVEHFKRLHFQGGIATVDEDKCHRIAIGADKCP